VETFFRDFGTPAQSLDLPPIPERNPRKEEFAAMHKRTVEMGVVNIPEI